MKKVFGKMAALLLALITALSLGACALGGDKIEPVENVQDALVKATDAMLGVQGFTIDGKTTVDDPQYNGLQIMNTTAAVLKTNDDYDFSAITEFTAEPLAEGKESETDVFIKKGNILYTSVPSDTDITYKTKYMRALTVADVKDKVQKALGKLNKCYLVPQKDGYTIEFGKGYVYGYGEDAAYYLYVLASNKDIPLASFIASQLGDESYTSEVLIADLNEILKDSNTIKKEVQLLDAFFVKAKIPATCEQLVDKLAEAGEIDAQTVYQALQKTEYKNIVSKPDAGETAYHYVVERMGNLVKVGAAMQTLGLDISLDEMRETVVPMLENHECTVGAMWDILAEKIDVYATALAMRIGNPEVVAKMKANGNPVFCMENLQKLSVKKIMLKLSVRLNGNLTVRAVNAEADIEILYREDETSEPDALVDMHVISEHTFGYTVPVVARPNAEVILPCILAPEKVKISELPVEGDYVLDVYCGKGVTMRNTLINSNPAITENGVTFAQDGEFGKLAVDAQTVAALRAASADEDFYAAIGVQSDKLPLAVLITRD